ncbi:hypothetical protein [Reichenbachiella sp. MALMAid0571]|uniref:hypothetical protein n=1 Tax=Reichenbachiella sp. MALMAid0571 TaxID=3143939 RepID=UPI0032DF7B1C
MKTTIVTNNNLWKDVAFRNTSFNSVLLALVKDGCIPKHRLPFCLNLEAKYELIRMESLEIVQFKDGNLELGENSKFLVNFCLEKQLGIAV